MSHDAILVGGLLILVITLILSRLQFAELLQPSPRTQVLLGLASGLVTLLGLLVLGHSAPVAGVYVYPVSMAFMALYVGPVAMATLAGTAFLGVAWSAPSAWPAAIAVLAAMALLGLLWRPASRQHPWMALASLAVILPPVIALCLQVTGAGPSPETLRAWLLNVPWHHGSGMLLLGAARQLLAARAQSALALNVAHHDLQERSQQLLLAMEALNGGRWEWEVTSRTFRCHGNFYQAFGIDPAEASAGGAELWQRWYARRHPQDAERNAARLARAMDGLEESYEAEFRVLDTQGRWRWLMSRGIVAERDAQGRPALLVGMDVDITAHHETEDALRTAEAKYTTIYQTLPDPAGISRISDGCYVDVNPAFCQVLGYTREDIVGRTSLELQIWATERERARLLEAFRRDGIVDRLPLVAQNISQGVLIPGLMSARPVQINGEDCFVFIFHDMTEVQRKNEELGAANNLLQQAGRMARLGAWEDELDKGLTSWTDVSLDIHGMEHGKPPPRNYIDTVVAPAYRETLRAKLRQSIQDRTEWSIEMEVQHTDGRLVWVRASGEPVVEDGRVTRLRGVIQDIDEAKRAEQRLRQSEERFSRFFHLMPYPMGISRYSDGMYVDINPAFEKLIGYTREQAIGRTAVELGVLAVDQRAQLIEHARKTGEMNALEVEISTALGERLTVLQTMRQTEFDGEKRWMFAVQDITDRKKSEEQLREREELLSLTLSAASLGLWDWNLQTGTITGDDRWRTLRGLPPQDADDAAPASTQWTDGLAPDDMERIRAELARHTAHPDTPFDATWRTGQPSPVGDAMRWVRSLGKIVGFDAQGRPARMLGVAIDVTPQREQEMLLQRLALYDALTGLPNRVLLARRLQESMTQARESGTQLGVAYLDLDGFKPVNDRLGHGAGDRLLVVVAGRLTRALRPVDCVARLGGDEFVILMPGLGSVSECQDMLQRVMNSIAAPYTLDAERVVVTGSIGYTVFPQDDADADTLLRHSDQAMYVAKQAGRNRFHQFDAAQERAQQHLREQGHHLQSALANAQFTLYLQPKVDMKTGTVVGAEALARWEHPERGLVSPAEFLPLLESSGLETLFGGWVVESAIKILEQLQARGLSLPVSINISAQHLQQPGFADWMAQRLALHPTVPAHKVEIEITESAALLDLATVAAALYDLRELGMTVSLDDFGTGYSSLTYLRRLPLDTLKIDQSFVHGMMGDPGDLAIVQGVIGLARSFGHRVIAEGVETVEQGQMLLQLGCTHAQGYCIARPMPLEAFIAWVREWQPPPQWQRQRPL